MSSPTETSPPQAPTGGLGLGTFLGVYTPTVLTILGVILYLRMGWVVGNAGVGGTILIVVIAHAITGITALSMSALSTSMRVGVGGAYYIISRSLGLELGGALGIPLYLSQVLSVTLYAFGLAESTMFVANVLFGYEAPAVLVQVIAAVIIVAVTALAAKSTVLALKMQLPIMGFIGVSLIALWGGVYFMDMDLPGRVALQGSYPDADFWGVFAVFFPAVTGVLAGVGLSGDLKDPSKSIPAGVGWAVLTGFIVYVTAPIVLGQAADAETLRTESLIWTQVSIAGAFAILPGLFGAVFSSAIGSILGAPRTLQALSQDGLMPAKLGKLDEKTGEPMFALYLSGGVALIAVLLGDLNAVAAVVSMFFLTTYGMLNLAAALEDWVNDPAYRPRFRVPFWVSLIGTVGCFLAMALINPVAFVVAVIVELGIWYWLARRRLEATWGDLRTGLLFAIARFAMVKLRTARHDARNWRPHILVFSADLQNDVGVVHMAAHMGQDRGIVSVIQLIPGQLGEHSNAQRVRERNVELLEKAGVLAFSEVHTLFGDLEEGLLMAAQANGFAGIDSNMMCFRWPRKDERLPRMLSWVRHFDALGKSTMVMRPVKGSRTQGNGEILVWWKGMEANGDLMLLLAHLLTGSADWRNARITLCSVVRSDAEAAALERRVRVGLTDSNIATDLEIIVLPEGASAREVLQKRSARADLVFLGLPLVSEGQDAAAAEGLDALVQGMPSTILVRNSGPFRGRLV